MYSINNKDIVIKNGVQIEQNVEIEDHVYIDYNTIIRSNVRIKEGTYIGANCILGEYLADFYKDRNAADHKLCIGENSIIRSGSIIYGACEIGDHFQTGQNVTIRENSKIGNHVSIGTYCDIQGECSIGNYVRMQSGVYIAQKSVIKDYVWIFPHVVLTNDPTPPSNELCGVTIEQFSVIAAGSVLLPGIVIESDSVVAAGAVVTKNVKKGQVVAGNPARVIGDIEN
ncbi:MAG: N-acetyltransferase, partial [Bacilli bacterium]|nr:N-acetyltransferase [Bacilli bacterium]